MLPPIHSACADFITPLPNGTNPQLAIVFIHFGGATSPLPTPRCLPVSWFYMLLHLRPAESKPVAMETTHKDEVEERRERAAYIRAVEGGRKRVTLLPCDWLQASSNPTHPSLCVIISGAKLVTAAAVAAAGSLSSPPRFIESLSVMLCPVCGPVTQPKDVRWGEDGGSDLISERMPGDDLKGRWIGWTQRRYVGMGNIFCSLGVTDAKQTQREKRGLPEGDANNDKGGRFQVTLVLKQWRATPGDKECDKGSSQLMMQVTVQWDRRQKEAQQQQQQNNNNALTVFC